MTAYVIQLVPSGLYLRAGTPAHYTAFKAEARRFEFLTIAHGVATLDLELAPEQYAVRVIDVSEVSTCAR